MFSSHILISAPKQYIFNFLNEIKLFKQTLISAGHDMAFLKIFIHQKW